MNKEESVVCYPKIVKNVGDKTMWDKLMKLVRKSDKHGSKGIELQPYYKELLNRVSLEEGISPMQIIEEGIKLYCQKRNFNTVKLTEQEERFNKFRKDLEEYLLEHLDTNSPKYKEISYWCQCVSDRKLTDNALDYQLRKIVEEMYMKPRAASIKFISDLKIDRRELQTIIINFLERC